MIERKDKTQVEFWKEYFEAKMFYENKTKKDLLANVSAKNKAVSTTSTAISTDSIDTDAFINGGGGRAGVCSEINAKSFKMASVYNDSSKDIDPYRRQLPETKKREPNSDPAAAAAPPRKLIRLPQQAEYSPLTPQRSVSDEQRDEEEDGRDSRTVFGEHKGDAQTFGASDKGAQDFQSLVKESVRIERKDDFSDLVLCPEYDFVKRACGKVHFLCTEVWSRVPSDAPEDERVIRAKLAHMQEMVAELERMKASALASTSSNKDEMAEALNGLCNLLKHTMTKVKQIKNFELN